MIFPMPANADVTSPTPIDGIAVELSPFEFLSSGQVSSGLIAGASAAAPKEGEAIGDSPGHDVLIDTGEIRVSIPD